eukprot:TRINITY_DN41541_c0_g1_i1.p1 TRINITY_DN41541_c0_g1~~TRINITY_DN41541_c0_g1_i1.p1  ORF type:complete len:1129 (+),score=189.55 TRINITY_DN41541_c0_g1_i1:30-3416(+)
MNVPMSLMPLLLSRSARQRLLDEMQKHVLQQCTKDPAMPDALQNLITALVRVFWAEISVELELDASSSQRQGEDDEEDETAQGSCSSGSGPLSRVLFPLFGASTLGQGSRRQAEELAAVPDIARGMLQVLVVEARDLTPVHGIGTNPYVRGMLGQQVRRSQTVWSNLRPAWHCLMEFPIVSTRGTLELEVMSRAPLFGGDTRLGYVSLMIEDIISPALGKASSSHDVASSSSSAQLAYRCEPLMGADKGELVLILDYRELRAGRRRLTCGAFGAALSRRAAQFRAFFLYHYWPCDKSVFQMYLHEPIDICLLLLSLSPFVLVRAVFYTVLLLCLCVPWPPDEHQIVQFILAVKGTAIVTDGAARLLWGMMAYYICARAGTCSSGGAPGCQVSTIQVVLDLYQEVLVWASCFLILPRSLPYLSRSSAREKLKGSSPEAEEVRRGGRMKAILQYNLIAFAFSLVLFLILSFRDVLAIRWSHGDLNGVEWKWRLAENFYWARTMFGFTMVPFLFLLHPQINKLLTHSTPTGFTRLGTLRRYKPLLRPRTRRPEPKDEIVELKPQQEACETAETSSLKNDVGENLPTESTSSGAMGRHVAEEEHLVDPVEDLKAVIKRFPGGSLALGAGSLWLQGAGATVGAAVTVVSFEIRVASAAVSLGLRAADAGRSAALGMARRVVPGSDTAAVRLMRRSAETAESTAVFVVGVCDKALQGPVAVGTRVVRCLPGGQSALSLLGTVTSVGTSVLRTACRLAAAAESPATATEAAQNIRPESAASSDCQLAGTCAVTSGAGLPTMELLQAAGGSELAELSEKAELLKVEAAARLAELLTRAERLAEREVFEAREALERVGPEIGKVAQALRDRSQGLTWELQRTKSACDSMLRSVFAWARAVGLRLPVAGQVLLGAFQRELDDLRKQDGGRRSFMQSFVAYSRVLCSSACEAFLELRPKQVGDAQAPNSPVAGPTAPHHIDASEVRAGRTGRRRYHSPRASPDARLLTRSSSRTRYEARRAWAAPYAAATPREVSLTGSVRRASSLERWQASASASASDPGSCHPDRRDESQEAPGPLSLPELQQSPSSGHGAAVDSEGDFDLARSASASVDSRALGSGPEPVDASHLAAPKRPAAAAG